VEDTKYQILHVDKRENVNPFNEREESVVNQHN